jgi:hypothetical protein
MKILNYPFRERILSGELTVDDVTHLCSERGGAAINIQSVVAATALQLKFFDIFYGRTTLQLWAPVHHNSSFKKQLKSMFI